jgi:hypothetical protein
LGQVLENIKILESKKIKISPIILLSLIHIQFHHLVSLQF